MTEPQITIVGGGVAGLCLAAELAERGVSLRIFDRYGRPAEHGCSWWAGGMLAPFPDMTSNHYSLAYLEQNSKLLYKKNHIQLN